MKLNINSVPTDFHAETNTVFVNPSSEVKDKHIKIGDYIYLIERDPDIDAGSICLNFIQRKISRATLFDSINLAETKGIPSESIVALSFKLVVEYFSVSNKSGTLDYRFFADCFKTKFKNQFITEGQSILVVHGGNKYVATIKEITFNDASSKYGLISDASNINIASTQLKDTEKEITITAEQVLKYIIRLLNKEIDNKQ